MSVLVKATPLVSNDDGGVDGNARNTGSRSFASLRVGNVRFSGASGDGKSTTHEACFAVLRKAANLCTSEDHEVFLLVARGNARVDCKDGAFRLTPGQWITFVRGSAPRIYAEHRSIVLVLLMHFEARLRVLPDFFPDQGIADAHFVQGALRLWRCSRHGLQPWLTPQLALQRAMHLLTSLQSHQARLIQECPGNTHDRRRAVFFRLQEAMRLMEGNPHRAILLEELSAICKMSNQNLTRTFNSVYGVGPCKMQSRIRFRRALFLLLNTTKTIGEISAESGFQSLSAFSRAFRRQFGISASAYRLTGVGRLEPQQKSP